ncbi:MAG: glycosyltransferase family 2 protein [Rhabdochlamydiaceae bacterium]|jgi:GT2 family glycosyltransferase
MKIAVVILHYRNLADTLECLESLNRQDHSNFEIIFVDNGSQDPNVEDAVKHFPRLFFVRNETNLGFAEGNNVAIRLALKRGAEGVLLLNNDTVCSRHLLTVFAEAAQTYPEAAAFGAKIFFYDDPTVIWHAGGNVHPLTLRCYHDGCPDSDLEKKWEKVRDIGYACGCALFVKSEAIKDVGLMAPEFFLIWEEIDWCWRLRKAGYRCLYIPEAKVWHKISRSFEGGNRGALWQYYYFRNRLLFLKRNFPLSKRIHFYLTRFPKELLELIFLSCSPKATHTQKKLNRAALKGITHYVLRRFGRGC